jgi:rhodanese-related sulfurtransferase
MLALAFAAALAAAAPPPNPQIDARAFVDDARAAARMRESRRVDEATFVRMMREPGTVVLDARSAAMYARRHVEGAVSLSLPDFTEATLARAIPDRRTRVLIYCNNNFANDDEAFPLKVRPASLNLPTRTALYSYGYRDVWELGPYVDVATTPIPLVPAPRARVTSGAAPAPSTPR